MTEILSIANFDSPRAWGGYMSKKGTSNLDCSGLLNIVYIPYFPN